MSGKSYFEIDITRQCFTDVPFDELPMVLMFELIDDVEVTGNILVAEYKKESFVNIN